MSVTEVRKVGQEKAFMRCTLRQALNGPSLKKALRDRTATSSTPGTGHVKPLEISKWGKYLSQGFSAWYPSLSGLGDVST